MDYHDLKPIVSTLFPIPFDKGQLQPSDEVDDRTLVCLDSGPSLYRGARTELLHYFGMELITELDSLKSKIVLQTLSR